MRLLILLSVAACTAPDAVDADGDGAGDADGDGLTNGEEASLGTDPDSPDTDADTYLDPWELLEGTDPVDPESRIYQGYWPYNPDKAVYADRDWSGATMELGAPLPAFAYLDQYGDLVHIYDFADQGAPLVLDVAAMWCVPCRGLSEWVSGGEDPFEFSAYWPDVPAAVDAGRVRWVTVVGQNLEGAPPSVEDLVAWDEEFGDPLVAVLADDGEVADHYIAFGAWPTVHLFTDTLDLRATSTEISHYAALDTLQRMLDDGEI
jgi:hypothetical protein